jgi:aryl-alcohol dehydrogenase-like predicted oxidoreductase
MFLSQKQNVCALPSSGSMPYRTLGRTGVRVSAIGLGGWHIGIQNDEKESIAIIRTAIDNGINFLDNCWDYNDGQSELRMGKALKDGYRDKAFLMTKIDGRDKVSAAKQIDECLKRLKTDHIDLVQFHEIIRLSDTRIFDSGGSIEAALAARKAGKIRFIGFTGHKSPQIHLQFLKTAQQHGFTFDTVQMPLNVMDAHYDSFAKLVIPVLLEHNIGVLGMKPLGFGVILKTRTVTPIECLHYALNLPTSVVITGCDTMAILEQALNAARTFKPLTHEELATLLEKTAVKGAQGQFEPYKTRSVFDGTTHHPEWMG